MAHFDKDGSGEVDCNEFLLEFFKLGTHSSYHMSITCRKHPVGLPTRQPPLMLGVVAVAGFEERSRRIKLYRQREVMHEKKRQRDEDVKKRQELAKLYAGR